MQSCELQGGFEFKAHKDNEDDVSANITEAPLSHKPFNWCGTKVPQQQDLKAVHFNQIKYRYIYVYILFLLLSLG